MTRGTQPFRHLFSSWWDDKGPLGLLHAMQPLRKRYLHRFYDSVQGKSFLDIGCGGGITSELLAKEGAKVTGIDALQENIVVAKDHSQEQGLSIDYRCGDASQVHKMFPTQAFDGVIAFEVLEHVDDVIATLQSVRAVLKPEGFFLCSTLNRTLLSYIFGIFMAENVLRLLPKGTHQWSYFLKPAELRHAAYFTRARVVDIQGMSFRPLAWACKKNPWAYGSHTSMNYMAALQFSQ